jgi:hypothetical protein
VRLGATTLPAAVWLSRPLRYNQARTQKRESSLNAREAPVSCAYCAVLTAGAVGTPWCVGGYMVRLAVCASGGRGPSATAFVRST